MHIWIINQYAYTPSLSASTRQYALARELTKRGHKVVIVATSFYHKAHAETKLQPGENWKREIIDDITFVWLRTPPYSGNTLARLWNMLVFTIRVLRAVGLDEGPRPDVIIGSSPHLFAAWAAERLAERYHVPFVLEIRDLWPENLVQMSGLSPRHPLVSVMFYLERYLYSKSERILSAVPISQSALPKALDYMVSKGAKRDRFVWLPNGVDFEMLPVPDKHEDSKPFTFMYAGAHSLYSGLDTLLDAADILQRDSWGDRIRIQLIGDGSDKEHLQKTARERELDIVSFEPSVPKTHIYKLLQQADAFLMVYHSAPICQWGISPNKLFDYMVSMRPVLFALGTKYSPVDEARAGISVKAGDPRAIAEGMKVLAKTPYSERIAMGQRGHAFIAEHHNIQLLGKKLETTLMSLKSEWQR